MRAPGKIPIPEGSAPGSRWNTPSRSFWKRAKPPPISAAPKSKPPRRQGRGAPPPPAPAAPAAPPLRGVARKPPMVARLRLVAGAPHRADKGRRNLPAPARVRMGRTVQGRCRRPSPAPPRPGRDRRCPGGRSRPGCGTDRRIGVHLSRSYADRPTERSRWTACRTIAARLGEAKWADHPAFLPAPLSQAGCADEVPRPVEQAARRPRRETVGQRLRHQGLRAALQEVPDANAVWAGDRILKLKPSDVAVAVAVEGGLFTRS